MHKKQREKGVAGRLECCRGAQATSRVQPMEVTEGLGEGGGGLKKKSSSRELILWQIKHHQSFLFSEARK